MRVAQTATALEAALRLVVEGKHVFPCAINKRPTCPNGFKEAARDPARVRELWRLYPGELVGAVTGKPSGFAVLDLDAKRAAARQWWMENRCRLPKTRAHRTRSGGLHLFFLHEAGLRCTVGRIAPGVDTRGDGGYVIWWPANGFAVLSDARLASWPAWLMDIARPRAIVRSGKVTVPDDHCLQGLVRAIGSAPVGQRNNMLFWAACRVGDWVSSKLLDAGTAVAVLEAAGMEAGLPAVEARRTALSGIRTATGGR